MPNFLDINNKEVRDYTNTLRQMHRSDLPIVIRQTLNDTAFDVKRNTLEQEFKSQFVRRNKSFLRSQSGVKKADGWNVNAMYSQVGISPKGDGAESANELSLQEFGGAKKKPLVYMRQARGNSNKRMVQGSKYYNKFDKIRGDHANVKRHSRKSNFVASAIMAHRLGKLLIWDSKSGQTVFLINSIYLGAHGVVKVNATPIADYENNRMLRLKARPFVKPAGEKSYLKQETFYLRNARKRLNKYL